MGEYEDTLNQIKETLGSVPDFFKALPRDVLISDWGLMKKYQFGESVIPAKYREMIGLAIAANLKCPYCQAMHLGMAKFYGATDEELSELVFLASYTSRWSAMVHAQNYDLAKFREEAAAMSEYLMKKQQKVAQQARLG